jgi:DNA-binding NarL/FixJ family response regulator
VEDPKSVLEALRTLTQSLQKQYSFTEEEIQDALFSQTIPATIFRSDATPLESIISYLKSAGDTTTQIAKKLKRNKAYIESVLARGARHKEPEKDGLRVPLRIFQEESAGKALTQHLAQKGLSNKEIAALLCKDESTIWTWKKRGEQR